MQTSTPAQGWPSPCMPGHPSGGFSNGKKTLREVNHTETSLKKTKPVIASEFLSLKIDAWKMMYVHFMYCSCFGAFMA